MSCFDFITDEKLRSRIEFAVEADKMKNILRRTLITDSSRRENDAEHSWHLALMAMLLRDYAPPETDIARAVQLAVVHDLVEIYAGDTFAYDAKGNEDKRIREEAAADRLFGMLPDGQGEEFRALWEEFDAMETPDARYASAVDRLQPLIHNFLTDGHTWKGGAVHSAQVLERMAIIKQVSPELWQVVEGIVKASLDMGILTES